MFGFGDLGINGMVISVGKVSFYVVSGGFDLVKLMLVCLDLGISNVVLCVYDFYLGVDEFRFTGDAYFVVVIEFCFVVKDKWLNCLI